MNKQMAKEICVGDILEVKKEHNGFKYFIVTEKIKHKDSYVYNGFYCEAGSTPLIHTDFKEIVSRCTNLIDRNSLTTR